MAMVQQTAPDGSLIWVDEDTGGTVTVDSSQVDPKTNRSPGWIEMGQQALTALQTYQLNQINIQRAKMGLPPIDVSQYSGVGVRVGIAPQTQQLLIYGGLALLAVMVFQSVMKRR